MNVMSSGMSPALSSEEKSSLATPESVSSGEMSTSYGVALNLDYDTASVLDLIDKAVL